MEHQDNIFEQFKKASDNTAKTDFPGMEKVWSRIDAKLDTEVYQLQKRTNKAWQKYAIVASLVVGTVFAFQLWKHFESPKTFENNVVTTKENPNNLPVLPDTTAVVTTEPSLIDKKEIEKSLREQLKNAEVVAVVDTKPTADSITPRVMATPPVMPMAEEKSYTDYNYSRGAVASKRAKTEVAEQDSKKETSKSATMVQKAPPLVVIDGKATDKKVSDIENEDDLETLVELKEPLYIINGKEYTEKELFGPHPTSPYYPLNKQEIEAISIYQEDEAIELYGNKGKKGVVVIKTKGGKPTKK